MKKLISALLFVGLFTSSVEAQTQNVRAGRVLGNASAATAPAKDETLTSIFDRAMCATNNSAVARISGTWVCLASANNGVWITSAAGVPSISSTLPNAVQDNITRLGTVTSGSIPATLVTYLSAGTGAVSRTVQVRLSDAVNVTNFNVDPTGVADSTTGISQAQTYALSVSKCLFFPAGTYITTTQSLADNTCWLGENKLTTTIKLKNTTNANLLQGSSTNALNVTLKNFTLDGNRANNTLGDVLTVQGYGQTFENLLIINAPVRGMKTQSGTGSLPTIGNGHFSNIFIRATGGNGLEFVGPGDSHFNDITISNPCLVSGASAYGLYVNASAKFTNIAVANDDSGSGILACNAGTIIDTGGVATDWSNAHLESGGTALIISGDLTTMKAVRVYAPDGAQAAILTSDNNILDIAIGPSSDGGTLTYNGFHLGFGGDASSGNIINLNYAVTASTNASVPFIVTNSGGRNFVRVTGTGPAGMACISGSPAATDFVNVTLGGVAACASESRPALGVTGGGTGLAAGTSGGIPYFSSGTTIASSAALGAGLVVVGGGAGTTPATIANGQLPATATNDNAATGKVGEYIECSVTSAAAITLTSAVMQDICFIDITAGDWRISGLAEFQTGTGTTITILLANISLVAGTLDTTPGRLSILTFGSVGVAQVNGLDISVLNPDYRLSVTSTTRVYFGSRGTFGTSTLKVWGIGSARRMR